MTQALKKWQESSGFTLFQNSCFKKKRKTKMPDFINETQTIS